MDYYIARWGDSLEIRPPLVVGLLLTSLSAPVSLCSLTAIAKRSSAFPCSLSTLRRCPRCGNHIASFPSSPLTPTKIKMEGEGLVPIRTWYRGTKVVTQLCSHVIGWLKQLHYSYWNKWAVTASVRPWHGSNSSDGGEVPSTKVRLCLFTITMFRFEKNCYEATKKDLFG